MAFNTQILDLVDSTFSDETAMDGWATDAVKEIINILTPELKIECATITSLTSSTPMDLDATGKVFGARSNNISDYINMRTTWSGQTKVEFSQTTMDEDIAQRNRR